MNTENIIHPSQLMQLSITATTPAVQDVIREYAKTAESFSLVSKGIVNEWEMVIDRWRTSDNARHILSVVDSFKILNPQAYMSSGYHIILARQAYAKRYNYLHPSRRVSWRRLRKSQVDEACWEWLSEHD